MALCEFLTNFALEKEKNMAQKVDDLLIIPDVHGRDFWKDAVEKYSDLDVIFLGDYMDPYSNSIESISNSEALENFKELLEFKHKNNNRAVMLLGNHDMHYMSDDFFDMARGSRFSYSMQPKLEKLFHDNEKCFQLAYEVEYEGQHVLFTHAGVTAVWLKTHKDLLEVPDARHINALLHSPGGIAALACIGPCRGGFDEAGGILWADMSEVATEQAIPGCYQIFGHTQQREQPVITPQFANLDCRRAFLLSEVMKEAKA